MIRNMLKKIMTTDFLKNIMTTDILKNIILLFALLIFLFIAVNILTTIYTYINKRIRTGNILEGFKCKGYKEYNDNNYKNNYNINNILKILDTQKNNCPKVNAQTPFISILKSHKKDNKKCTCN